MGSANVKEVVCFFVAAFLPSCSRVPDDASSSPHQKKNEKLVSGSPQQKKIESVVSSSQQAAAPATATSALDPEKIFPTSASFLPPGITYADLVPDTFDLAERAARYIPGVVASADPNQFFAPAAAALSAEFKFGAPGPRLVVPYWGGPNWGEVMLAMAQAREMTAYDRDNASGTVATQHLMLKNMLKDKLYNIVIPGGGTTPMVYAMQSLIKTHQQKPTEDLLAAVGSLYKMILSQFKPIYNSGRVYSGLFGDLSPLNPDPKVGYMGPMYVPFIQGTTMVGLLELETMAEFSTDPSIRPATDSLRDLVLNLQGSYLWASPDPSKYPFIGAKGFAGHMYSWLESVRGVLMSAQALQSSSPSAASVYISFCRDIYDFVKQRTAAGWVGNFGSAGTTADMMMIGLLLTDFGAGDYLDEIDAWARNQMAEAEIDQRGSEYIPNYNSSEWATDHVGLKTKGLFFADATHIQSIPYLSQAFTTDDHGMSFRGLYELWKHIVTTKNSDAYLNFFMNYSGKSFDIKSDVPYRGRVEIITKQSLAGVKNLYVHIPAGTDPTKVRFSRLGTNGTMTPVSIALNVGPYGRYLLVKDIVANSRYVLEYPLWIHNLSVFQMRTDSQGWYESSFPAQPSDEHLQSWNGSFRGGTLVRIQGSPGNGIPRYVEPWRQTLSSLGSSEGAPPMVKVTRFVYGGDVTAIPR